MICGNVTRADGESYFQYRSSSYLTEFFADCDMEQFAHDGSTRKWWVADVLKQIVQQPSGDAGLPSRGFQTVVMLLMDQADATENDPEREAALSELNATLAREGLEAFYASDNCCYVRNTRIGTEGIPEAMLSQPLTVEGRQRQEDLEAFFDQASEDQLIADVLVPLFETLRFRRVSVAGHADKALEYGKDVWMKYELPTGHWLYFGLQAKKGRLDASARSHANVAEVLNQTRMMLDHVIFDPEVNNRRLVDHAIIAVGGEITKQAKNWLGESLDASQRSQILFMDRRDIVRLFIVHNVPPPGEPKVAAPNFKDDASF